MHNSAIFSLFLVGLREFLLLSLLSILLLLLPFINLFDDNAFSSENKTLKYIFEPFLKLNGTDFYDIESNDQLQLEDFTLGTWFRSNQSSFDEPAHIVNKGGFNNERTGKNMNYGVWMNTDGTITAGFEVDSGKNIEILSKKKYNDGKWHYVLVLYNSTVLRMDIDGHTIESLKTTRTPDTTGNQPLRLGANSLDLDKYFNGEVDELRVWNRGLAINELSEMYTNRNFTTNGQVEYLNFGKNIMEDNKERIDDDNNKSITNTTKEELLTTLGTTKQPPVIFVFVISKDILQELLTATAKQPPIIVEPKTPPPSTVTNNNSKTNTTTEDLPITTTKKQQQQPPIIVEPQAPSKTNATKEELPTTTTKKQQPPIVTKEQPPIVEPKTPSKTNATKEELPTTTTTKKQQPPIVTKEQPPIVEPQAPSKTNATKEELPTTTTTTTKKQPPIIVEPQVPSKNATKEELPTTTTTKKQQPPIVTKEQPPIIVEPQAPSKTNATKEELPTTTTTKKQQPPIIVEPQAPSKTNATKEELPTTTTTKKQQPPIIVEPQPQAPSKTNATKEELPTTTTTTKKQQQPPIGTKEELPTTTTTTKKQQQPPIGTKEELPTTTTTTTKKQQQQPPIIVKPKTSNQITTAPTLLSNNISKNTADNVRDKINLAFENLSVERSVTNSVVIKGDIKNNSTQDLQEVKVFAEYYDKTGTLLAKIDHFITSPSSILKPTEQVSFDILEVLGFGFHKLGDYNIVASGETIN